MPPPVRVDAVALETRAAALFSRSIKDGAKRAALERAIGLLDLTTLEGKDTPGKVRALCARARSPGDGAPPVAAVCIYPALIETARDALRGSSVRVASVASGFPSGLAPRELRIDEVFAARAAGADEIDVVIDRGALLAGRYDDIVEDVAAMRAAAEGATLKVILEVGELGSYAAMRRAADLALAGGADFLKTATGKLPLSTTPAIALLLVEAIRDHLRCGGRPVGLKLAGGIRTSKAALGYLALVAESLGGEWLVPERLRIGASALLDDLLLQRAREVAGAYASLRRIASA